MYTYDLVYNTEVKEREDLYEERPMIRNTEGCSLSLLLHLPITQIKTSCIQREAPSQTTQAVRVVGVRAYST